MPTPRVPIEQRLWRHVEKTPTCWLWTGALMRGGYGGIGDDAPSRRMRPVHRLSYELHFGRISDGLVINHLCRERRCVRPDHLEAVTQMANLRYSDLILQVRSGATHCPQGHEYTEDNIIRRPNGWRKCKKCHRDRMAAARARKRNSLVPIR